MNGSSANSIADSTKSVSKIDFFNHLIEQNNDKISTNVFSNNWEQIKANGPHLKK